MDSVGVRWQVENGGVTLTRWYWWINYDSPQFFYWFSCRTQRALKKLSLCPDGFGTVLWHSTQPTTTSFPEISIICQANLTTIWPFFEIWHHRYPRIGLTLYLTIDNMAKSKLCKERNSFFLTIDIMVIQIMQATETEHIKHLDTLFPNDVKIRFLSRPSFVCILIPFIFR